MNSDDELVEIPIAVPVEGALVVGVELFDLGQVTAGGKPVAKAGSVSAGQIVKAILLIEPAATMIKMPTGNRLQRLQREWQAAVKRWQTIFDTTADRILTGVTDVRTREAVINSAMVLMHAK